MTNRQDQRLSVRIASPERRRADDAAHKQSRILEERDLNQRSNMVGQFKRENFCIACEEVSFKQGDMVRCRGPCNQSYHFQCLSDKDQVKKRCPSDEDPVKKRCLSDEDPVKESYEWKDWKCFECANSRHSCQLCKSAEGSDVLRCSSKDCGRYFHQSCLQKNNLWPQARFFDRAMTCPAHMCHTCASENPSEPYMKYNTRLLQCVRCPTSYHSGDSCVTAGSVQITATHIICPKHFDAAKVARKSNGAKHINATWCFLCSKGGTLICCERCPHAFHKECLKLETVPEVYYCDHCETGRMPLYGEVVWVKLGNYRWWPARVLFPKEVPDNVERIPHDIGEFPVQFCGSLDYYWVNQGRCFLFDTDDADRISGASGTSQKGGLAGAYARGLVEAVQLHAEYLNAKQAREAANADKVRMQRGAKPPIFTRLKANRIVGDCPVYNTNDGAEIQACDCTSELKEPCGPDAECINRLLLTECTPSLCKAGDKCMNQRFQKREYPQTAVAQTDGRGWGLFAKEDLKKGQFIIEYVGELISMKEFKKRLNDSMRRNEGMNYYYMNMDNHRVIDAGPKGNNARFINHSCDPNCETQKWNVNGDTRVGLFAGGDIPSGTELTFNYQFETVGDAKKRCLCGAKNCSGFIGEKPSNKESISSGSTVNGGASASSGTTGRSRKVRKPRVPKQVKVWEDLCFRCLEDGELIMCDYKSCPKVYHLACLGRKKGISGKWFCPWHHCVTCGKTAVSYCRHCPNAYCKNHNSTLRSHPFLKLICDEHDDDIDEFVEFYKKIGGVGHLVPNPSVPLEEVAPLLKEEILENSLNGIRGRKRRLNTVLTDENSTSANASENWDHSGLREPGRSSALPLKSQENSIKVRNPKCKCLELECDWIGERELLVKHLFEAHDMSQDDLQSFLPITSPKKARRD